MVADMKSDQSLEERGVSVTRESIFGTELTPYSEAEGLKRSHAQIANMRKAKPAPHESVPSCTAQKLASQAA